MSLLARPARSMSQRRSPDERSDIRERQVRYAPGCSLRSFRATKLRIQFSNSPDANDLKPALAERQRSEFDAGTRTVSADCPSPRSPQ